jgi:hypothetical protein
MGALALEEYRIECALCREGEFGVPYERQLPPMLSDWCSALAAAGVRWNAIQAQRTLEVTNEIMTRAAYVAAEHMCGNAVPEAILGSDDWASLVGECWPMLLRIVETVPSAESPLEPTKLGALVREMAALAEVWCERIGFNLCAEADELFVVPLTEIASADRPAA